MTALLLGRILLVFVFVAPFLLFSRGKKHWLTIEFKDVADLPQAGRDDPLNYLAQSTSAPMPVPMAPLIA